MTLPTTEGCQSAALDCFADAAWRRSEMALAIARGNGLSWSADDDGHCSAFERVMVHSASQMTLPAPRHDAEVSLEHALQYRRSIREFARGALTLAEVGQLLTPAAG